MQSQGKYIVIAFTLVGLAGASAQTVTPVPAPATAPEEPNYPNTTRVPEDMIRRRPRQVIVLPSEPGDYGEDSLQLSGGVLGKVQPDAHRLPEGYDIAGTTVSVQQQGDWMICYLAGDRLAEAPNAQAAGWVSDLDAGRMPAGMVSFCQEKGVGLAPETTVTVESPGRSWRLVDPHRAVMVERDKQGLLVRAALPLRVLPNKRLMMLEAILSSSTEKRSSFAVTGRLTEFQGQNYILIEHISELVDVRTNNDEQPDASKNAAPFPTKAGEATSAPATRQPRPEEIIKHLLESKPRRAVVLPQTAAVDVPKTQPASPIAEGQGALDQQLWPEETILVDRPGRLVQSDKYWTLAFEDKGVRSTRRPVRLLPNRMLENAIAIGGDKSMGVILIVSGETTEYRGNNYLLLRKVLVQPDMGNLK